jgi:predicted DNA-binding transcriptional regulator YafY
VSFKFDSLMIILNKLDHGEKVTVQSLMDDLEVKERSVHRYLSTLVTAGFPIVYDRKHASYRFEEGYTLKKAFFSPEESLAFGIAKRLLRNLGPSLEANLDRIKEKIAIPARDTSKYVVITPGPLPVDIGERLAMLHEAAMNFQRMEILYRALSTGEAISRKVDPYYLFYNDGFWQLRGFCHLRAGFRTFALDRVVSLKLLDEYFLPREISPEAELSGLFGAYVDGEPTEVIVRFDQEIRKYVERNRYHQTQVQRELPDGRLQVTFTANGIEGVRHWLYRWLPHVEVVAPDALRDTVTRELETALMKHGGQS